MPKSRPPKCNHIRLALLLAAAAAVISWSVACGEGNSDRALLEDTASDWTIMEKAEFLSDVPCRYYFRKNRMEMQQTCLYRKEKLALYEREVVAAETLAAPTTK